MYERQALEDQIAEMKEMLTHEAMKREELEDLVYNTPARVGGSPCDVLCDV
jgi:hypothetical protein